MARRTKIMSKVGLALREIRKRNKLSLRQFYTPLGVTGAQGGNYETMNNEVPIYLILRLIKHYNVKLEEVFANDVKNSLTLERERGSFKPSFINLPIIGEIKRGTEKMIVEALTPDKFISLDRNALEHPELCEAYTTPENIPSLFIKRNDRIIVETGNESDDCAAIIIEGGQKHFYTIKRLGRYTILLNPLTGEFTQRVTEHVRILGCVVGVQRYGIDNCR